MRWASSRSWARGRTSSSSRRCSAVRPSISGELHTRYVEEHAADLVTTEVRPARYFSPENARGAKLAGAKVDPDDPLAVLNVRPGEGKAPGPALAEPHATGPEGSRAVAAPIQGMVIAISVGVGDEVRLGQSVAVMEALKMEHTIVADTAGVVREIALDVGEAVFEGTPILFVEPAEVEGGSSSPKSPSTSTPCVATSPRFFISTT